MIKKLQVHIPTLKWDTLLSYSIEDVRKECTKYLKYTMHKIKVNRATVHAHGCVASCSSLHMGQEILRLNHSRRQCE
jgi:hypothetical protein